MIKIPMLMIYMILSLNITAAALVVQFDWLIFHAIIVNSLTTRVVLWLLAAGSWVLAYTKRDIYVTLR